MKKINILVFIGISIFDANAAPRKFVTPKKFSEYISEKLKEKILSKFEPDVNELLIKMVKFNKIEFLRFLLKQKADVNAKDKDGNTALIKACEYGYAECVKLLLESKADVFIKNNNGKSALDYISKNPELEKLYEEFIKANY